MSIANGKEVKGLVKLWYSHGMSQDAHPLQIPTVPPTAKPQPLAVPLAPIRARSKQHPAASALPAGVLAKMQLHMKRLEQKQDFRAEGGRAGGEDFKFGSARLQAAQSQRLEQSQGVQKLASQNDKISNLEHQLRAAQMQSGALEFQLARLLLLGSFSAAELRLRLSVGLCRFQAVHAMFVTTPA